MEQETDNGGQIVLISCQTLSFSQNGPRHLTTSNSKPTNGLRPTVLLEMTLSPGFLLQRCL